MSKDLFSDLTSGSIDDRYNKLNQDTLNKMAASEIEEAIKEYKLREQDFIWSKEVVNFYNKVLQYDDEIIKFVSNFNELEELYQKANVVFEEEQKNRAKRIQDEINERNARIEREKLELEQSIKEHDSRILTLYNTKVKGEFWLSDVETLLGELGKFSETDLKKFKNLKIVDELKKIVPFVKKALDINKDILLLDTCSVKDKKWCDKVLSYQIPYEYKDYVTQKDVLQGLIVSANNILNRLEEEQQLKAEQKQKEKEEKERLKKEREELEEKLIFEAHMKEYEKELEIEKQKKKNAENKLLNEFENRNRNFCLNFDVEVKDDKIYLTGVKDELPKKLVVPKGVHIIGEKAFEHLSELESVELSDTVEKVDDGAFSYCRYLTSFKIGAGLKEFNVMAFYGCDKLNKFEVSKSNAKFETYKGDIYSKGLKEFYCFAPGKKERKYKFPSQTRDVLYGAFAGNKYIKVVDCNKVNSLAVEVFKDCVNLKVVKLGKNMKFIFDRCFANCVNLKRVVVKHKVTVSEKYKMFIDCKKLDKKCKEYFKGFREK